MAIECASCGTTDDVDAVCHHCGKPLCRNVENCRFELEDPAFGSTPAAPVVAVHCRECWQIHHPAAHPRRTGQTP